MNLREIAYRDVSLRKISQGNAFCDESNDVWGTIWTTFFYRFEYLGLDDKMIM
jgi:hypothetical protein